MFLETRKFSNALLKSKKFQDALKTSSRSEKDYNYRVATYSELWDNYQKIKARIKKLSSYAQSDIQANMFFNAMVSSMARSFSGYLSLEKSMNKPVGLLEFLDTYDVATGTLVVPNLGAENFGSNGYRNKFNTSVTLTNGTYAYTATASGKSVLPGSVTLQYITSGVVQWTATDDKNGHLISQANKLTVGTVSYTSPMTVTFTLVQNPVTATDSVNIVAIQDQTGDQSINRFEDVLKTVNVSTSPMTITQETNLVTMAAIEEALKMDAAEIAVGRLSDIYTKLTNLYQVNEIVNNDISTPVTINMDPTQFHDYDSILHNFVGGLENANTSLALQSYKGLSASCYLASTKAATYFKKLKSIGNFKAAKSTYINDLVGYYDDIPVLQHVSVPANAVYAVCKLEDGSLAPVMRGMFLPMTPAPIVANYNNVTQMANGIYSMEAFTSVAPLLAQRINLTNVV